MDALLDDLSKSKRKLWGRERARKNLQYIYDYLVGRACIDCGENDPMVLEFDHVRGIKTLKLSKLVHCTTRIERIQEEIDKCDVRCANCHRRKSLLEQGALRDISFTVPPKPVQECPVCLVELEDSAEAFLTDRTLTDPLSHRGDGSLEPDKNRPLIAYMIRE